MTPSTLPSKLYRPLAEVKSFVEKMPDGVTLTRLSNKVGAFGSLSKREKDSLIEFLEQRESILVLQAKPLNGKNVMTFLRHKKYGYPNSIPGYAFPLKAQPVQKAVATAEPPKTQDNPMENLAVATTPEALRRQAEQLLKAAEEAEKKRSETDFFNKKLQPVKLEVFQAAGKMQRKLDEFIDCMDEMNKALQKLKELSA
ncbi:TPA: hypothetical protein JAW44_002489 [Citrobacter werkmanii]|uniref:Uncharacterized protein n=1 Tax=Citrobacter werkmanii TaxID=67827 RepID=A0AA37Z8Z5_9ENTR|nr:hypothetical protein [Citrobacter werkmanii]